MNINVIIWMMNMNNLFEIDDEGNKKLVSIFSNHDQGSTP